jgi:hypothetical protein
MKTDLRKDRGQPLSKAPPRRVTKKEQILSLFGSGVTDVEALADITGVRSSYVASVLRGVGVLNGYFDLYTTSKQTMNIYSQFFAGQLGFRDEEAARQSVAIIDDYYHEFERAGDRAGQHHALTMALTMFDRARWIKNAREAEVFRQWLLDRLLEIDDASAPSQERKRLPARQPPRK